MNELEVRRCSACAGVRQSNASLQRIVSQLEAERAKLTTERDQARAERNEARQELADRKVIDRAKGILMDRAKLSEHDAYHRMRRAAMQHGHKLVDVARTVLAEAAAAASAECASPLLSREEGVRRIGELVARASGA